MDMIRCDWANKSELEKIYHDTKWGKPVHDDKEIFKMLSLEGMQAGLSWATILSKWDSLCQAFDDFDPNKIVAYDSKKIEILLQNKGIIRNRLKVNAVINNTRSYFDLCEKYGSLDQFLWDYVDNKTVINYWETMEEVPSNTTLFEKISKQLKKEGFKFAGTTTIYALMQSIGIVNDHIISCSFRHVE